MGDLLIAAQRVFTGDRDGPELRPGLVRIADGLVTEVRSGEPGAEADVRLDGGVLAPGFVDLQVNGYVGVDFGEVAPDGWRHVASRLPETGVTSFVPTFISAPVPVLAGRLRAAAEVLRQLGGGARVLGIHLEGPFLAVERRGAHDPDVLTDPDPAAVQALLEAGGPLLRIVTLAPERPGALDAVRTLVRAGVLVGVGHSEATAAQTRAAADAGARLVTHLFNAQRPLHHREPGVVGQALLDRRLTSTLIADLHHVAGEVCRLAFEAAGGRVGLISDAVAAAGMPPGRYRLAGQTVTSTGDGPPTLPDGTLAGSALRLDDAVRNLVDHGVDLVTAINAATRIPARLVGRDDLGRIAPGSPADLVWLDHDLRARATWVGGRSVYGDACRAPYRDGCPDAGAGRGG